MMFKKSPCIGVCKMNEEVGLCSGCMRSEQELGFWKSTDLETKKRVWSQLGERRITYPGQSYIRDQLKRTLRMDFPVKKIVSLVPSLTQSLYDLGLEEQVVGITRFCPKGTFGTKLSVGGTKNVHLDKINSLSPDLILANKEENTREIIEDLETLFPVWVSEVVTLRDSLELIWSLGEYLNCQEQAVPLAEKISTQLEKVKRPEEKSAAYLIWKNPYMVAGSDTFIHSWLAHLGFRNVFAERTRYPQVILEEIQEASPDQIFLPDEPYFFRNDDVEFFSKLLPQAKISRIDGKLFSWHGTHMLKAIDYFLGEEVVVIARK